MLRLLNPKLAALSRREFNACLYQDYFDGEDSPSARASLSRALRRLEQRDYIIRTQGCYQLNPDIGAGAYAVAGCIAIAVLKSQEEKRLNSKSTTHD
jgi:hypothetical protein